MTWKHVAVIVGVAAMITLPAGRAQKRSAMDLGTFSISLTVKDVKASRAFYENLGFAVIDGKEEQNWLMLANGAAKIGLFQGMFEKNTITFNPPDVRGIQSELKRKGVALVKEAKDGTGPEYITLQDPDGNPVLLDQH